MKKALVIGGSNGIGLAIALQLAERGTAQVVIIDKDEPAVPLPANVTFVRHNLLDDDLAFLPDPADVDALVFTAGFGRVAPFESILQAEISNQFQVNAVSPVKVLRHFFPRMRQPQPFHCAVMGSIAGWVAGVNQGDALQWRRQRPVADQCAGRRNRRADAGR